MNRKAQTHKRPRKKRAAIPVQPPKVPSFGMGSYVQPPEVPMMYQSRMKQQSTVGVVAAATLGAAEKRVGGLIGSTWKGGASNEMLLQQEDESSACGDVSSPRDNSSPIFGILAAAKAAKEHAEMQQQLQQRPRTKEEEKQERRRAKDDATRLRKMLEKEKELEKKAAKRKSKKGEAVAPVASSLSDFVQSENNCIPLFLEKCIQFIEQEGLDSEGIYRVPGNRAHVDLLYQKFEEGEWGQEREDE